MLLLASENRAEWELFTLLHNLCQCTAVLTLFSPRYASDSTVECVLLSYTHTQRHEHTAAWAHSSAGGEKLTRTRWMHFLDCNLKVYDEKEKSPGSSDVQSGPYTIGRYAALRSSATPKRRTNKHLAWGCARRRTRHLNSGLSGLNPDVWPPYTARTCWASLKSGQKVSLLLHM